MPPARWVMPAKVYVDAPPGRRLPRDARSRRRDRDAEVGDLVPRQPRPRAAGRRRGAAGLQRRDRRAARDHGLRRDHLAAHRRRGGGLGVDAGRARMRGRSGSIGCGVNGAWAARCLAAAGYGDGRVLRPAAPRPPRRSRPSSAGASAAASGRPPQDVVVTVTPADRAGDRRRRPATRASTWRCSAPTPHGKAEVELDALERCRAVLRRVGAGVEGRRALRPRWRRRRRARAGNRDRRRAARTRAGAQRRRRDHPLRLDRARDPGPRDRARGARGAPRGRVAAASISL